MKRLRVRIAMVIVAAAAVAGCFSDPAESLRNGPASLRLTRASTTVPVGDSVQVEATVVDDQGNILPAEGAVWTSDDPAIADVALAETQLPANGSSRAYIRGVATLGGITTVRVTIRGVTDSVRVSALPTVFPAGIAAVTGTAQADTTVLGVAYTAGDTLTVTAPPGLVFNATSSVVQLGGLPTYLLSRTTTTLKVLAIQPHNNAPVTVTNVTWLGDATTGDLTLPTMDTPDNYSVARARFRGTAAVGNDVYGTGTLLTLTAQAGTTFNAGATNLSNVSFGLAPAMILSRTATTITAIARAGYTGPVKVTNVNVGTVRVDSLFTPAPATVAVATLPNANVTVRSGAFGANTEVKVVPPTGTTFSATTGTVVMGTTTGTILHRSADSMVVITSAAHNGTVRANNLLSASALPIDSLRSSTASVVAAAFFPGTAVNGGGGMMDTIKIAGNGLATFTTTAASASTVTINGATAFIVRRTADSIYAIARANGTSRAAISNVIVGTTTVPSLSSSNQLTVGPTTAETNEPGNDAFATGNTVTAPVAVNDTVTRYGTIGTADTEDYWRFTPATTGSYRVIVDFLTAAIDIDAITMSATFPGYACGGPVITDGCSGATGNAAGSETSTSASLTAGTTYATWVMLYDAHGNPTPVTYRIRFIRLT